MSAIVSVIAVLGALVLAWHGFRSHRLGNGRAVQLAAIWGAIIIGLVLLLKVVGV